MRIKWRIILISVAIAIATFANSYLLFVVWRKIWRALKADKNGGNNSEYNGSTFEEVFVRNTTSKISYDAAEQTRGDDNRNALASATSRTSIRVHVTTLREPKRILNSQATNNVENFITTGGAKILHDTKNLLPTTTITGKVDAHRHRHSHHHQQSHHYRWNSNGHHLNVDNEHHLNKSLMNATKNDRQIKMIEKNNPYHYHFINYNRKNDITLAPTPGVAPINTTFSNSPLAHAKITIDRKNAQISAAVNRRTSVLPMIRVTLADLRQLATRQQQKTTLSQNAEPHKNEREINQQITIVTALLDIGREKWPHYGRPFFKYHDFMRNVLRLSVPMVVFVDGRSTEFVRRERANVGLLHLTMIHEITIEELPLFRYHRLMQSVIDNELNGGNWRPEWDDSMRNHPETFNYNYDIVVNSKAYFLHNASMENHFDTEFLVWLDGGYGHGNASYFPPNFNWRPTFPTGSITLIKLTPETDLLSRYDLNQLYRQDVAVVSGGFLAGDRKTLAEFYQLYHWKVVRLLTQNNVIDDDQTILVLLINEQPNLFNVVLGDWFDAFKI